MKSKTLLQSSITNFILKPRQGHKLPRCKYGACGSAIVNKALSNSLVSSVVTNISLIIGKVAAASITKTIGAIVVKNTAIYVSHNLSIILAKVMAIRNFSITAGKSLLPC